MSEILRALPVTLEDLRQLAGEQRLYAVLDACDAPAIQAKVAELGPARALCLYRGEVSRDILAVAPYLVRMDSVLIRWLIETVWREPWGIFVAAKLEPEVVRKHLRKLLLVKDEAGETMYFRYYDPRVMPLFLESCTNKELVSFFGNISAFGASQGALSALVSFYLMSNLEGQSVSAL